MGVATSRTGNHQGGPEAAQLLHAIKRGEHLKALRLLRLLPATTQSIPQAAKAAAIHSAIKRGYVSILQLLRDFPVNGSDADATSQLSAPSVGRGTTVPSSAQSRAHASRLSQSNGAPGTGRGAGSGGRLSSERESWLNALDRHGRSPLFTAVRHNRLEFVEGLVSLGADPWVCDRATRGTALHLAAMLGHAPLVAALLKSPVVGPDHRIALFDSQDMYGFTPLHYAACSGHADVARVLLDAGASYTASSQLAYDPSPAGLRRLSSLTSVASGLVGISLGHGGGGTSEDRTRGVPFIPCAPRSNPLHVAALRGDGVIATLVLQRFLADTDGLNRGARERITDPRTQLNKDGFQPYMLAGNAGHWHVAQLLIPHSRDDRHHLSRNRDRDFLIFFPLPEPTATGTVGSGDGEGPPSLVELAARVWAGKLLADVKLAEAAVRQLQQQQQGQSCVAQYSLLTSSPVSVGGSTALFREPFRIGGGGGGGGGVLGALFRRSGRGAGGPSSGALAAAATACSSSRRELVALTASSVTIATAAGSGPSAAAAGVAVASRNAPAVVETSCGVAEASPGASAVSTPRTSASGGGVGAVSVSDVGTAGSVGAAGGCRTGSPPRRAQLHPLAVTPRGSRRTTSLDLTPRSSATAVATLAVAVAAAVPPTPPVASSRQLLPVPSRALLLRQPSTTAAGALAPVATAPASPVGPSLMPAAGALPMPMPAPLCDVCFEQPQELALRPCPHRMCASCCRRVVEMHCVGVVMATAAVAATARAPGRRPAAAPPRCPFCQATIRGFIPAAASRQ